MGVSCCKADGAHTNRAKTHLDESFGHGTAEALQKISELLEMVDTTISGGLTLSHPYLVNLGMILKQVSQQRRYAKPITSGFKFNNARVMRKAARYAKFASAAYGSDKQKMAEYIGSIQGEDIKYVHQPTGLCPHFFVAADPEGEDIVLCIRGTASAADALSDLACAKEPFMGGKVHSGILDSAQLVADAAKGHLMRLSQEMPRKSIAIVGHSLGAGAAILATVLLSAEGQPLSRLMAASKVKCYAFASPPVFEPHWALPPWVHASVYSFINNMDVVPRACLGTVSKLYLALKAVDALPLTPLQRLAYLRGDHDLEHNLPDFVEVPQDLQVPLGSLFGVGKLILFYRGLDSMANCETVTPHMTDRILMHPNMIKDHMMVGYEQATADAVLQMKSSAFCC
mmetsp:Transcript_78220/g.205265  ORF Transcript_78220/g.205265 Transcript_78220/m.205265 type:complete len:399 (-) Transcript_78220:14-1210(-)